MGNRVEIIQNRGEIKQKFKDQGDDAWELDRFQPKLNIEYSVGNDGELGWRSQQEKS